MHFTITEATDDDLRFVRSSWTYGYRESPRTCRWPVEAYSIFIVDQLDRILPRSTTLVARPPDWSEGILAWLCFEQRPDQHIVHAAYVKPPYRRTGIATALLEASKPHGALSFSHLRPPYVEPLKRRGYVFDRRAAE